MTYEIRGSNGFLMSFCEIITSAMSQPYSVSVCSAKVICCTFCCLLEVNLVLKRPGWKGDMDDQTFRIGFWLGLYKMAWGRYH